MLAFARCLEWYGHPDNKDEAALFLKEVPDLLVEGKIPSSYSVVPEKVWCNQHAYTFFVSWMQHKAKKNALNEGYEYSTILNYNRDLMHVVKVTLEQAYTTAGKAVPPMVVDFFKVLDPNQSGNSWLQLMEFQLKGSVASGQREAGVRPTLEEDAPPISLKDLSVVSKALQFVGTKDAFTRLAISVITYQNCDRAGEAALMRMYLTEWCPIYGVPWHLIWQPKVQEYKLGVWLPYNPQSKEAPLLDIFFTMGNAAMTGVFNHDYNGDSIEPVFFPSQEPLHSSTRSKNLTSVL